MNTFDSRVDWLNANLPGRVRIADLLPRDIDPKVFARIRGGAAGWFDDKTGSVVLYRPNLKGDVSRMDASVAFIHVSRLGLENFLGKSDYKALCVKVSHMLNGRGAMSFSFEDNVRFGDQFIGSCTGRHDERWDSIAFFVSEIIGLKASYALAESLCKGQAHHNAFLLKNAAKNADFEVLGERVRQVMEESSDRKSLLSLGHAGEVFVRMGYPEADVLIEANTLKSFVEHSGWNYGVEEALFRIQDPLAVIEEGQGRDRSGTCMTFVTDLLVPGKGFLALSVKPVNEFVKGYLSGDYRNIRVMQIRFVSEYSLMQSLSREKGKSICYLRPKHGKDGSSYVVSDLIARWDGRTPESMGYKKSADGKVQGVTPSQLSRRLIITANIVENFKNPISVEQRIRLYGKIKYESMKEDYNRKNQTPNFVDVDLVTMKPAESRPYRERLSTVISTSHFSAGAVRRLNSDGVRKAMDIISMGADQFRERYGLRVFKSAQSFLEANSLGFTNSFKIMTISEASLAGLTPEERMRVRERDLVNSLAYVPQNVMSRQIKMPRDSEGRYYSGADAVNLIAKSVSIPRWRDCNIFLSRSEMEKYGLSVDKGAVPCHISDGKGNPLVVFNLSETDYASLHPSMFDVLSQMSRNVSADVPSYVKNMVFAHTGIGQSHASTAYRMLDQGYMRNVQSELSCSRSSTLSSLASDAARQVGVRNPLETRGRKAKPKDVLKEMERGMKEGKDNGVKFRK